MKKALSLTMMTLIVFSMLSILQINPVMAATDEYFIYSRFDPPGIGDVVGVGGYVEYYGVPEWGDEIQYVYFLSGTTGYKVKVTVTDGDGDGKIEPRQHPSHYLSEFQGPIEPRNFEIVSSVNLAGYTSGSGGHSEEFYVDSGGVYLGAYSNGIHKWDHDWSFIGKIANRPPTRTESMAYNPAENIWYAGGRYRTIYQLSDTDSDGSFLDESWTAIFTYPNYGGSHHDGMEYVGGYLWISDMTSDVIGKWEYDTATSTWKELKRFTYTEPASVEGMGFGPNDHFWCGSGWGSGSYIYELGNEITKGYPIADAGDDVDAHPPTIPVEFDASGSHHTDPAKEIVLYEWDFESDGTWDYSGTDLAVEHAYPAYYNPDGSIDWSITAKDYTATLRVTDNSDPALQDIDTCIAHITAPPWKPVADPDGPYESYVGMVVQLDGSESYDPDSSMFPSDHPWYETIASYEWDLDNDGQFDDATGSMPTHMWTDEGIYTIRLKVTDSQPSGPGGSFGLLDIDTEYSTVVIRSGLIVNLGIVPANTADEAIVHDAIPEPPAEWIAAHLSRYTVADREDDLDIRWIVLHVISPGTPNIPDGGYSGTVNSWSTTSDETSSHYIIKMDGSEITQMVRDKDISHHAGNWKYNQHSIGIEIAGYSGTTMWPDSLYHKAGWLTRFLAEKYGVELDNLVGIAPADPGTSTGIVGHNQVPCPKSKYLPTNDPNYDPQHNHQPNQVGGGIRHHTDPGSTWDWSKFMSYVDNPRANTYFSNIGEKITNYYLETSYGAILVNFEVYHEQDGNWFTLPQSSAWYSARGSRTFIEHAIDSSDDVVNFRKHDYDSEDGIGIVAFVPPSDVLGNGAFISGSRSTGGAYNTDDDTTVDAIYVHEPRFRDERRVIRGLAHEFAHSLGKLLVTRNTGSSRDCWWFLPDLYTMGDVDKHWGLMGRLRGQYNIERVHLSSYSKEWLGWLEYEDTQMGETYTVESLVTLEYGDDVLRYSYDGNTHFYIMEHRTSSSSRSEWDTETLHAQVIAFYQVDVRPDDEQCQTDTVNLERTLTEPDTFSDPSAGVTFNLLAISEENARVSIEEYKEKSLVGAVLDTLADVLSKVRSLIPHEAIAEVSLPDIDLHAYSEDGRHVGMNYDTGEYEIQIPGTLASGDLLSGREWIFVPEDVSVYFAVNAKDNAEFLDSFPEARELTDGMEAYNIGIVYYDPFENRYESSPVAQQIMPGDEIIHRFAIILNSDGTYTPVIDDTPPLLTVEVPQENVALQDGVALTASAWDENGVSSVTFSIREPNGEQGTIISPEFEFMPASPSTDDKWELPFDTTLLPDGYYLAYVEATDIAGNVASEVVPFSIRNWACIELLPASESNKAGRTMPVKFWLRVVEAVDPAMPFVYNEELTILIYEESHPESILQESTYGDTARDYRIDSINELYITNFRTIRTKPTTYVVEVYRKDMLIGSFTFETVK